MTPEQMEARLVSLENQLRVVQDIHGIEKLQRIYGFYLEHWMAEEIIDLFSDSPDVALEWPEGSYFGKEGVRRYFQSMDLKDPEFLHQLMQLSPVIDVAPDGETALARWYSFGGVAAPRGGGVDQSFESGTYENEYIKEAGTWKIKRITWHHNFSAHPKDGWVAPERVAAADPKAKRHEVVPDSPDTRDALKYPAGYVFPFHFKHPVTGNKTSENERNVALKRH